MVDWVHQLATDGDPFAAHPKLRRYADLKAGPEGALGARSGVFVAEGPEAIRHLLASDGVRIESLLLKHTVFARMRRQIEKRRERDSERDSALYLKTNTVGVMGGGGGFDVFVAPSQRNFTEAVGYNARGALACGSVPAGRDVAWLRSELRRKDYDGDDDNDDDKGIGGGGGGGGGPDTNGSGWRLLAVDGCNNPANLGNLIRTAAALQVDAVLLSDDCCDAWYRRSVRVSMGCCFRIPIVRCNLGRALATLQNEDNVETFAALLSDTAAPLARMATAHARNSAGKERWCCVVGSEAVGISLEVQAVCRRHVRIPMAEGIDSLSITTATAIILARLRDAAAEGPGGGASQKGGLALWQAAVAVFLAGAVLGAGLSRYKHKR
jgi:tRNA G18 (ribose-2'-O)-methylase SpoU